MRKTVMSGVAFAGALAVFSVPHGQLLHAAPAAADCAESSNSWSTTNPWDAKKFGSYFISNDNFNNTPGQRIWASSEHCFGVTTSSTTERSTVGSYPHVVRGWMQNEGDMKAQSSGGTFDWTVKSGMGVPVKLLNKAKVRWAFAAPNTAGSRWMALIDVYFHKIATPTAKEFPPALDLMIDQAIADQVVNSTTYYALVAQQSHASTVTLGGNRYLVYVDNPGESAYHQSGGHTIHLFQTPTAYDGRTGANWGSMDATTDIAAIVKYFMQANPRDDAGHPLQTASGSDIAAPLITSDLFLNAVNAGWEVDVGTTFQTSQFWVAMQEEPDGG